MPFPIHSASVSVHSISLPESSAAAPISSESGDISTLPAPSDPLAGMIAGGDVGPAIAALIMLTQKEARKSARTERDLAYAMEDKAQKEELAAMERASEMRFYTGMLEGGLKLGAAAFSTAGATQSFRAAQNGDRIDALSKLESPSAADKIELAHLKDLTNQLKGDSIAFDGTARGLEAYNSFVKPIGGLFSEASDRDAKAAANRATTFRRTAEEAAEDGADAKKSIDRAMTFLEQWLSGRAAQQLAAIQRA